MKDETDGPPWHGHLALAIAASKTDARQLTQKK
jgi:hypothetical protein